MIAVILNAGQGMRLRPYTNDRPKGMVEVAGRPLLAYVLQFVAACQADRVIVVGGFEAGKVEAYLATHAPDVQFLKNPDPTKGNLSSLTTALPHIDDSLLLLNADHVYGLPIAERVVAGRANITAFCDTDRSLGIDDMKVQVQNGILHTISKKLETFSHGYVGMTYVDAAMLPHYRFAAEQLLRESDGTVAVEAVLGHLAAQHHAVAIGDISGVGWLEIDTPEELVAAEAAITHNPTHFFAPEHAKILAV